MADSKAIRFRSSKQKQLVCSPWATNNNKNMVITWLTSFDEELYSSRDLGSGKMVLSGLQ